MSIMLAFQTFKTDLADLREKCVNRYKAE